MSNPNHKNHVVSGLKVVFVVIAVMMFLSVVTFVAPFVFAALSAVLTVALPIVGVCLLVAAGIWTLGFLFNTGKAGVGKVDVNKLKSKFKRS